MEALARLKTQVHPRPVIKFVYYESLFDSPEVSLLAPSYSSCKQVFFFGKFAKLHRGLIRGRMTVTDGSWETPHPSSVTDGMGGPTPPSVMRTGWYRWPVHPSVNSNVPHRHRTQPDG
jgi:hypothetical protein